MLTKNIQKLFLVFSLGLAACTVFEGRQTAGQYVDDASITARVKEAFVADPQVKVFQIHVETMNGVVQLSGFVDSQASERRAVEIAQRQRGVKSVRDDIIIRQR